MAIDVSHWRKLPDGLLELHTVLAYQAVPIDDGVVALRIEYVTSQQHLDQVRRKHAEPSVLQVRLTHAQADQMLGAVRQIQQAIDGLAGPKH